MRSNYRQKLEIAVSDVCWGDNLFNRILRIEIASTNQAVIKKGS